MVDKQAAFTRSPISWKTDTGAFATVPVVVIVVVSAVVYLHNEWGEKATRTCF